MCLNFQFLGTIAKYFTKNYFLHGNNHAVPDLLFWQTFLQNYMCLFMLQISVFYNSEEKDLNQLFLQNQPCAASRKRHSVMKKIEKCPILFSTLRL
jgi:hypothetical protein